MVIVNDKECILYIMYPHRSAYNVVYLVQRYYRCTLFVYIDERIYPLINTFYVFIDISVLVSSTYHR